jgi:hypothetical protein
MIGVQFVDALVGAFVAVRIFIDALGLSRDALSQARGQGVDMSKYHVTLEQPYKASREATLRTWILYVIGEDVSATEREIIESVEEVLSIEKSIPFVSELRLSPRADSREFDLLIKTLIDAGLVRKEGERFVLTPSGNRRVNRALRSLRYNRRDQVVMRSEVLQEA